NRCDFSVPNGEGEREVGASATVKSLAKTRGRQALWANSRPSANFPGCFRDDRSFASPCQALLHPNFVAPKPASPSAPVAKSASEEGSGTEGAVGTIAVAVNIVGPEAAVLNE